MRGRGEVATALEQLNPRGSLIRVARFEPISVRGPSDEEGREHVTVRIFRCRAIRHFLAERQTCPTE